jgi:hypothetical protein
MLREVETVAPTGPLTTMSEKVAVAVDDAPRLQIPPTTGSMSWAYV